MGGGGDIKRWSLSMELGPNQERLTMLTVITIVSHDQEQWDKYQSVFCKGTESREHIYMYIF